MLFLPNCCAANGGRVNSRKWKQCRPHPRKRTVTSTNSRCPATGMRSTIASGGRPPRFKQKLPITTRSVLTLVMHDNTANVAAFLEQSPEHLLATSQQHVYATPSTRVHTPDDLLLSDDILESRQYSRPLRSKSRNSTIMHGHYQAPVSTLTAVGDNGKIV